MNSEASLTIEEEIVIKTGSKGYWKKSHYISLGFTGHWTKWGGARKDIIQENLSEVWACQSCGKEQPALLSPIKYEYPQGEWIRICSLCKADDCLALKYRI